MNALDLAAEYERRRAEARRHGATAPVATVYEVVIDELRALDGTSASERLVSSGEAARILRVCAKTVRRKCAAGEMPGAVKTSGESGEWRIPLASVYRLAAPDSARSVPKLWSPDDE